MYGPSVFLKLPWTIKVLRMLNMLGNEKTGLYLRMLVVYNNTKWYLRMSLCNAPKNAFVKTPTPRETFIPKLQ